MDGNAAEPCWTQEQWNKVSTIVAQEAQKARTAAQFLPADGVSDPTAVAVPLLSLDAQPNPGPNQPPADRLYVDNDPTLFLTTISVLVQLHTNEVADPELKAALVMFRRAANYIARIEDALVFNGRPGVDLPPPAGIVGIPPVFRVTGRGIVSGFFNIAPGQPNNRIIVPLQPPITDIVLVAAIIQAIDDLENAGQLGPYACVLSHDLFQIICTPTANMVLPRDRALPFLQGPLLRSSAIPPFAGTVVALNGNPIELVVGCDIHVKYVQTTLEPRYVFRVSEKVALRIKESEAIAILQ